jgi:hypothetical protein
MRTKALGLTGSFGLVATMFATAGASTKEIMSRGGWKSMALVVRYGTPRKRAMRSWPRR